jgi:hypothetical protein
MLILSGKEWYRSNKEFILFCEKLPKGGINEENHIIFCSIRLIIIMAHDV